MKGGRAGVEQVYFEEVTVGDPIPAREFGPLTIIDTVRWAGVQENPERLHWDREYAREHSGLPTFIASGGHRQALLARSLTDWIGPSGVLRQLSVRHSHPTHEGDLMRFFGKVVEKSADPGAPWVKCELEGQNQEGQRILTGRCTLLLPIRDARQS